MSKREEYSLEFLRIRDNEDNSIFYSCDGDKTISGSIDLSLLLESISNTEADSLLEEIVDAINGTNEEEDYLLDQDSSIWIDFTPPNAKINGGGGLYSYIIPLIDLKQLLEEWLEFLES